MSEVEREVPALLRERGYAVAQGNPELVGLIEEQLRLRGWVDPDAKPKPARKERAVSKAPERAVES